MSGLPRQHMSGLSRQHMSGLSRQHMSGLSRQHMSGLSRLHMSGLSRQHMSGLSDHFLVMSGSLFREVWDMLGDAWAYSAVVFGWIWDGFGKKFRRGRKHEILKCVWE